MSEQNEQIIFEIISHGGNAKSLAYKALDAATAFNFEQANELMAESKQEMSKAHNIQTELIQSEINGDKVQTSLLMIHAQDHLMTAISEKNLIEKMIELYQKLEEKC
ncbi:PTS lichenan transporter subunit IIA [Staphylococcus ureilyticus]|uniref:PTS lactose/cellobiose transporter subunit IIA n=1 Tax=Staphylococcus ureilyticus TaxID=94138 RepID=UPI000D1C3139|nr:PTS lactose/cellobiose transporter subunit IIA [Staphylococcus ureilyticus]MDU0462380.1 PTS lactose/cellobiose transporter subunit IIA [Staphylococcus ureilyticus]MDV3053140.1 PTS lichenan transporter subunit IIA [Staphylococcus ureilyticus]PTF27382.1 PTS lactose/cellobiose transporter subunit IIA [Staphylococcus cohnii]